MKAWRVVQIGHYPDTRPTTHDYAGCFVGQIKTPNGWQDDTDMYQVENGNIQAARDAAMNDLICNHGDER